MVLVQLQNNDHSPSHFVALGLEVPQTKTPQFLKILNLPC